jgi:hypothetical protein
VTLGILLTFAVATTSGTGTASPGKLELVVLKGDWSSLGWRYQEPPRPAADAERLFTAAGADIDTYTWSSQALTLTVAASARLEQALTGVAPSVPKLSALKESLGEGNSLDRVLYLHGFFVALDGEPLYWGIFLDPPSQMAIEFPVLRVQRHESKIVFHILPVHLPFFESDPIPSASTSATSPEAREVPGTMLDVFHEQAQRPLAAAFRARIRDERVRLALEKNGSLRP